MGKRKKPYDMEEVQREFEARVAEPLNTSNIHINLSYIIGEDDLRVGGEGYKYGPARIADITVRQVEGGTEIDVVLEIIKDEDEGDNSG